MFDPQTRGAAQALRKIKRNGVKKLNGAQARPEFQIGSPVRSNLYAHKKIITRIQVRIIFETNETSESPRIFINMYDDGAYRFDESSKSNSPLQVRQN
ncbi:MAG: hypothetical protein GF421_05650, partial [Candidatus Aminicenantes bacterium]|nr:hypothetical protein [Candidatus Aminicenantes bacterium]